MVEITILDEDGTETILSPWELIEDFTAVNFTDLLDGGYSTTTPDSFTAVTGAGEIDFHDYLWLLEKTSISGSTGDVDSRNVTVYKLLTIEVVDSDTRYALTFQRVY